MNRPTSDIACVFGNKPVAFIGASIGGFGTVLSQDAWLPVLRMLGTAPWYGGRLLVRRAAQAFEADGALSDAESRRQLREFIAGFCAYADTARGTAGLEVSRQEHKR